MYYKLIYSISIFFYEIPNIYTNIIYKYIYFGSDILKIEIKTNKKREIFFF